LCAGWGSNRKYAVLGGLRAAAQTISYEIRLAFLIISVLTFNTVASFKHLALNYSLSFMAAPLLLVVGPWLISCVAELNRTPFDFAEGESELVSGFNVEYGSIKFALIFIAEYGIIYILALLTSFTFFLPGHEIHRLGAFLGVAFMFCVIWLRTTLPRFRYDLLIELAWKTLLPARLGLSQIAVAFYCAV